MSQKTLRIGKDDLPIANWQTEHLVQPDNTGPTDDIDMGFSGRLCNICMIPLMSQVVCCAKLVKAEPVGELSVVEMGCLELNGVTGADTLVKANGNLRVSVRLHNVTWKNLTLPRNKNVRTLHSAREKSEPQCVRSVQNTMEQLMDREIDPLFDLYHAHKLELHKLREVIRSYSCAFAKDNLDLGQCGEFSPPEEPHQFFNGCIISPTREGVKWIDR